MSRIEHTVVRYHEERLRKVVNTSPTHERLAEDKQKFNQLCASMDALGDTDSAVAAFQKMDKVANYGLRYLTIYGILQVLFVQQDAVKHIAEAVGMRYEFSDAIKTVREIRNSAIGHPTKREKTKESFGIIRMSVGHRRFEIYSFDWNKGTQEVDIADLIAIQTEEVCEAIDSVVSFLEKASA